MAGCSAIRQHVNALLTRTLPFKRVGLLVGRYDAWQSRHEWR